MYNSTQRWQIELIWIILLKALCHNRKYNPTFFMTFTQIYVMCSKKKHHLDILDKNYRVKEYLISAIKGIYLDLPNYIRVNARCQITTFGSNIMRRLL